MRVRQIIYAAFLMLLSTPIWAQTGKDVVVDYNNPKKYIVGGVKVEGNNYFAPEQIIQITGLQKGMEVTVPGEELSSIVNRLWLQRYFEDVAVVVDSLAPSRDTAFFKIAIIERPRVSRWTFSGVKHGEEKELQDRLSLRRGGEFSEYVAKTSSDIIKRFYKEKGFLNKPKACKACRDAKKNAQREPREYFTVVCSECGGEAKVTFQPSPERPVYCSECFAKRRQPRD
jgi:outer membrane protein insertion porin family